MAEAPTTRNILLIGPTQAGKTTLAHFLCTGRSHRMSVPKADDKRLLMVDSEFVIGNYQESATVAVHGHKVDHGFRRPASEEEAAVLQPPLQASAEELAGDGERDGEQAFVDEAMRVNVIDTPGIGDTNERDSEHMLDVYANLLDMHRAEQRVSLAVLVVRFPTLFTDTVKRHLDYYRRMLPALFDQNVVLLVTGVAMFDDEWVQEERTPQHTVQSRIEELQRQVHAALGFGLTRELPMFTFEGTFSDRQAANGYLSAARGVRFQLLQRACGTAGLPLDSLRLPKPPVWLEQDCTEANKLRATALAKQQEWNERMMERDDAAVEVSDRADAHVVALAMLDRLRAENRRDDSATLVSLWEKPYVQDWSFGFTMNIVPFVKNASCDFTAQTAHDIASYELHGTGYVQFERDDARYKQGRIRRGIFRNVNATLVFFGTRRDVYADDIRRRKIRIEELERDIEELSAQKRGAQRQLGARADEAAALQDEIDELLSKVAALQADYVDLSCVDGTRLKETLDRLRAEAAARTSAALTREAQLQDEQMRETRKIRAAAAAAAGATANNDIDDIVLSSSDDGEMAGFGSPSNKGEKKKAKKGKKENGGKSEKKTKKTEKGTKKEKKGKPSTKT